MVSERSLKKKATYCMLPFKWLSGKGKTGAVGGGVVDKKQMIDCQGLGEGGGLRL